MEYYKTNNYDLKTGQKEEIEIKIPVNLVNEIEQKLYLMEGYHVTPKMINPEDNSIVFGIMDLNDNSLKYKLTISTN